MVKLGMFGSFSHTFLKNRKILDRLESKLFDKVRKLIKMSTFPEETILGNLLFTF
jgi:hypothetical protein